MIHVLATMFSLLCSAPPPTRAMVVLDFQAKGILDKAILRDLWDRTHEIASAAVPGRLLDTTETRRRLFDQSILVPARCDQNCYARMGDKLQARELLVPTVEKSADQVKITFVLVDGRSGSIIAQSTAWSDGRIGQALDASLSDVLKSVGSKNDVSISRRAIVATGILAAGTGAILMMGLDAPSTETPASPQRNTTDPDIVIVD